MSLRRVEIVTVGDELLSGETIDTNSNYLDQVLEQAGWRVVRHTTVPDQVEAIVEVFREAVTRADAVISCGGLGPTCDDLTMEALARAMGVGLRRDEATLAAIRDRFRSFGREMMPNNERQAMVPSRGVVIPNRAGTAPGFLARILGIPIFLLPGVPSEVRDLMVREILPRLASGSDPKPDCDRFVRKRRTIKVIGLGESRLEHEIRDVMAQHRRVVWGFRTLGLENHVKMLVDSETSDGTRVLDAAEADLSEVLGSRIFGRDDATLETVVLEKLEAKGQTLAVAESCTGGLITKQLTDVPGASRSLLGGVVSYADAVKCHLLGVDEAMLSQCGAVSAEVAEAMAIGVRARLGASVGLSVTGVAGPSGGRPTKPVGLVYVGIADAAGSDTSRIQLPGDRARVRSSSATWALDFVRRRLERYP
ncbi:MAG: competence/damage-inducible protein A [Deltaproteobacteria bacterium]|nr:competence/damage-inducible protein A [Deltaproteobacteria bacterium]